MSYETRGKLPRQHGGKTRFPREGTVDWQRQHASFRSAGDRLAAEQVIGLRAEWVQGERNPHLEAHRQRVRVRLIELEPGRPG